MTTNKALMILAALGLGALCAAPAKAETMVLQFLGTAAASVGTAGLSAEAAAEIEATGVDVSSLLCFEMDLMDPEASILVGTGVDCVNPNQAPVPGADPVELSDVSSFFMLPGGTFVAQGTTTARAFIPGFGDANGAFTHLTGSIPVSNNINAGAGTGDFQGRTGRARLSGALDGSDLGNGNLFFNCLWLITLDGPAAQPNARGVGNPHGR